MNFPRFSGLLSLSFLLTPQELKALLESLGALLVRIDKVCPEPLVPLEAFMAAYEIYWAQLCRGESPERAFLREHLQVALTRSLDSLIFLPHHIVKAKEPLVMLRPLHEKGLEALYPRIFQEGGTDIIYQTFPPGRFVNTALFQELQRSLRRHSLPLPGSQLRASEAAKKDLGIMS